MYFHTAIIAFVLLVLVNAATLHVDVGKGGALKFDPEIITASGDDIVLFHFYTGSNPHSVVSGPFDKPCTYDQDNHGYSFWSGDIEGDKDGNKTFRVNIPNQEPMWFYCSIGHHCQHGMVGVINPPAEKQGLTQYRSTAAIVGNSTAPPSPPFTISGEGSEGNSTTAPGNSTSTSTGSGIATTNKPTGPASSAAAASSTSSGMAGTYVATPEVGSLFIGLMGLIGAAFI